MEAPATSLTFYPSIDGGVADVSDGFLPQVDPFLVEALENPRHRLTVLRMELDVQRFMQNPEQYQFEFQPIPTSYLRRAAHRVAQHYGLQTAVVEDGSNGRITARKTPDSRPPAVCLSEIPAKQHESEMGERGVKIAIRPRPGKGSAGDAGKLGGGGVNTSPPRSVEERKEDYDKARARIFMEGSGSDVRSSFSTEDGQDYEVGGSLDCGASRVAIFRDREKDRSDPDYDRSYDRYVRGLAPGQDFGLRGCSVVQPPFLQYEAQLMPSNLHPPFCAFGPNQASSEGVFMQWPSMMYAQQQPFDHFKHAVFQVPPFYQIPLSFDHSPNW